MKNILNNKQEELLANLLNDASPDQLKYLQAYLDGFSFSLHKKSLPTASIITDTVSILYGSQTGNSKSIAESLYQKLSSLGLKARILSLEDYNKSDLKKEKYLIFVVSTQGNGVPPISALEFFEFIQSRRMPKLSETKYSVLALGDSSYKKFCVAGVQLDNIMSANGAQPILPVEKLDVDFKNDSVLWINKLVESFSMSDSTNHSVNNADSDYNSIEAKADILSEDYSWNKSFEAEVIDKLLITTDVSSSKVFHVELSLENSNMQYQEGDYVAVNTLGSSQEKTDYKYFPISSSMLASGDDLHFVIDDIDINKKLLTEIEEVGKLNIYIEKNKNFHLPSDDSKPLVMLALGSNVAPYHSFLKNIESESLSTETNLFFVNKSFKDDFLYQTNFQKLLKSGVLNYMDISFSDSDDYHILMQELIQRNADKIFNLLEKNAVLYISAPNSSHQYIEDYIYSLIKVQLGNDDNKAKRYFKKLKKSNNLLISAFV